MGLRRVSGVGESLGKRRMLVWTEEGDGLGDHSQGKDGNMGWAWRRRRG